MDSHGLPTHTNTRQNFILSRDPGDRHANAVQRSPVRAQEVTLPGIHWRVAQWGGFICDHDAMITPATLGEILFQVAAGLAPLNLFIIWRISWACQ
jgi:hypothetical protein